MTKRVRQAWPWGLNFSSCQHYPMNKLSGLLSLWLGWSVDRRLTTAAWGGDEGSVCVCVFLPCLTLSWWGDTFLKWILIWEHSCTVGVSGKLQNLLLLHTVRTPGAAFNLQSYLIWQLTFPDLQRLLDYRNSLMKWYLSSKLLNVFFRNKNDIFCIFHIYIDI